MLSLIVRQSGLGFLTRPTPGIARYFGDASLHGWVLRGSGDPGTPINQPHPEPVVGASGSSDPALNVRPPAKPNGDDVVAVKTSISLLEWFVYLWIALSVLVLTRLISSALGEISILRRAHPITDPRIQETLERALLRLNLQA